MKFIYGILISVTLLSSGAFASGKGDVTCFFLYQAADGSFPLFSDQTHMVQWGKPGTYFLNYTGLVGTVAIETEIRTSPFDHAFMKITYTEPSRGLNFSSRGTLAPSDETGNQANLILETSIPPTLANGVVCEKFFTSCLITN